MSQRLLVPPSRFLGFTPDFPEFLSQRPRIRKIRSNQEAHSISVAEHNFQIGLTMQTACSRLLLLPLVALLIANAASAGPIFVGLPQFGQQGPIVSGDGSTVVGTTYQAPNNRAQWGTADVKWQTAQTLNFGGISTTKSAVVTGTSYDGSVVVGTTNASGNVNGGFRWTAAGGMQQLQGTGVPGYPVTGVSQVNGVSADGNSIVGAVGITQGNFDGSPINGTTAAFWNSAGQLTLLPPPSTTLVNGQTANTWANAISADGSKIAGLGNGVKWFLGSTNSPTLLNQTIPSLGFQNAVHLSGNGDVLYGNLNGQGIYWTQQSGKVTLGAGTSGILGANVQLTSASADGKLFGGTDSVRPSDVAMIWDSTHGFQFVRDLLTNQYGLGSALAGWHLNGVTGMSADGMVIAGNGVGPTALPGTGGSESWVVDLRNELANTGFNLGLNGWNVAGQGAATTIADPFNSNNTVAQLTTSSALSIGQTLATPNGPFDLNFDYAFRSTTGVLDVYLGSTLVGEISAPARLGTGLSHESLLISDPGLWGLADTTLTLRLDPSQQSQLLLDNFGVEPLAKNAIPEPSSVLIFGLGIVGLLAIVRQSKRAEVGA
jgi:hypothetical protein